MALTYCTKCGHRVSTTAPKCPGCGMPPYRRGPEAPPANYDRLRKMKRCPYCAEEIQDDAIKCRFCGEKLGTVSRPATFVRESPAERAKQAAVVSDGDKTSLCSLIVDAIKDSKYVLQSADFNAGLITFETPGLTMNSWSGEVTVVTVNESNDGSVALFASKGKPSGRMRLSYATSAHKALRVLLPIMQRRLSAAP